MEPITTDTVRHIARLAQLELPDNAVPKLAEQLGRIVHFVEQLRDVPSVSHNVHAGPAEAPLRTDSAALNPDSAKILDNAPAREGRFFTVPQVIA